MKLSELFTQDKLSLSFEVFPPKTTSSFESVREAVEKIAELHPSFMSVTYGAGGSNSKKTATIASYIKNICEIEAIAHMTAVAMDQTFLTKLLDELKEKRISNVLALRGDRPKDMSDEDYDNRTFLYAEDIIRIIRQQSDELCVAAACYPEMHPESASRQMDLQYLKQKVDTGVNFLITQMFFDNSKFYEFRDEARKCGIDIPITTGIMPITSAKQLGTSVSLSGTSVPQALSNLVAKYADKPEDMRKAGIEYATKQIEDLIANDVDGIHLYTMNKAATACEIMGNLSR